MKKNLLLIVLLSLVHLASAQTELYNRYSKHTNIKVACINNMSLDDGSLIEVTIFEANDDQGWSWILNEFNVGAQPQGHSSIMFSMRNLHNPAQPAPVKGETLDQENSCYMGVDFKNQTIYFFAALSGSSPDNLLKYLVAKMIKQ